MDYFKRILKHYLILTLENTIGVDSDTHAELDGMLADLEAYIDVRIKAAIEEHETACWACGGRNDEQGTTPPPPTPPRPQMLKGRHPRRVIQAERDGLEVTCLERAALTPPTCDCDKGEEVRK